MTVSRPGPYIHHYCSLRKLYVFRGQGNDVIMDVYNFAYRYLSSYRVAKPFFRLITGKTPFSKGQSFAEIITAYLAREWRPSAKQCVLKPLLPQVQAPEIYPDQTLKLKSRKRDYYDIFPHTQFQISPEGFLVVAYNKRLSFFDIKKNFVLFAV